ncbi:hypothetical protein L8P25_20200 [Enterobacter cloacae]|uniref:hypothetical protein n=1 Tax=Enterobacter cloacae TaxID=550 RepID=UPI0020054506|nr:hypothetical protein [Enterobacter cloacae]MCK7221008.1 hypothetical protein [Enterobacter cloacae]
MSTITKEWLQKTISQHEALRDEIPFGLDEGDSNTLAALRIALASLEAEPVYQFWNVKTHEWVGCDKATHDSFAYSQRRVLYTTPPAPVSVPDEALKRLLPDAEKAEFWFEHDGKILFEGVKFNNAVLKACRVAMLQSFGNSEQLNSQVIPDCSCRTCRPVTFSDSRFVVCPECGNKRCPHANDHRNACTGSNEPGQEGSAYPSAPQQELKP